MAFSVGGTNVGGVRAIEAGDLICTNATTTFGGTGLKSVNFTVPVGKIWIFKKASMITTGTATLTYNNLNIRNAGSNSVELVGNSTTSLGSTVNYMDGLAGCLTLPAGFIIRISVNVTANTDGAIVGRVLYQEVDA